MSSSKKQSLLIIAVAMLIIAGIMLYFALSQPKEYVSDNASSLYVTDEGNTSVKESVSQVQSSENSVSFPININTCSAQELIAVDGVGVATASAIIEYRDYLGGYTSVEQIKNISGIGDGVYDKISPYLCV